MTNDEIAVTIGFILSVIGLLVAVGLGIVLVSAPIVYLISILF